MKKYKIISAILLCGITISTVIAQVENATNIENKKIFYSNIPIVELKSEELEKINYKITENLKINNDPNTYIPEKRIEISKFFNNDKSLKYEVKKTNEYINFNEYDWSNDKVITINQNDIIEGKHIMEIEICKNDIPEIQGKSYNIR